MHRVTGLATPTQSPHAARWQPQAQHPRSCNHRTHANAADTPADTPSWSAAERRGAIVASHSLPGAPLVQMPRQLRRFLRQNPSELVVVLVKADTIDVNVAGSQRFTDADCAAAAEVFQQELQGVQLVNEQQVQQLTLGQLAAGSRGGGSVLLYNELQRQGLPAAGSAQGQNLESWGNGTNTEDVEQLKQRLVDWLLFWRAAWRQNQQPFLLLASAEVTLGVKTILEMVKNRLWGGGWAAHAAAATPMQHQHQQPCSGSSRLASGLTTLYQLGVETNKQLMQAVLGNSEVPKELNVWALDAISPDITHIIIELNRLQPAANNGSGPQAQQ